MGRQTRKTIWILAIATMAALCLAGTALAAISEVGNAGSSGSGVAASITHGLTINENDVIFVVVNVNSATTISDNNGSYALTQAIQENNADNGGRYAIFYRVAGASEPSSYQWSLSASVRWSVTLRVFSGVDTGSVWDVAPSTSTRSSSTSGSTATAPSMTTQTNGAMGILAFISDDINTRWSGPTNSYGTIVESYDQQAQGNFIRTWANAGSTGATSATMSETNDWVAHQFALKAVGITVDGTPSTGSTDGTQITISHTTHGSNRLMIVGVSINNDSLETVSSVTYNAVSLTPLTAYTNTDDAYAQIWYLVAPATGTHNVVITFSADLQRSAVAGVITFTGVDQTAPLGTVAGNNAISSTASVTGVSSATGELVIDVVSGETVTSLTATSPQQEQWNLSEPLGGSEEFGGGSTKAGASTVDMSWALGSSDYWAITAVSIKPNQSPRAPQTPYCEGQATPVTGVTDLTPEFSAIYDDADTSDTAEYYEIEVTTAEPWWNSSWTRRRKLTIDNSVQAENLTDFPMLVKLDATRIDYAQTQNSGEDIRFVDTDGSTVLKHEIEEWNESGTSYVWVKVPQIDGSSSSDYIYMYYGNAAATDAQNVTTVWSNGYVGVWHLDQDPGPGGSGDIKDSTQYNNDGTAEVSMTSGDLISNGKINGAFDFDGNDDYVDVPDHSTLDITDNLTMEVWLKVTTFDLGWQHVIGKGNDTYQIRRHSSTDYLRFDLQSGIVADVYSNDVNDGNWHYIVGTYSSSVGKAIMYQNGALVNDPTVSGSINSDAATFNIGYNSGQSGRVWEGLLDEVRISNVARSADWIAAQHKSMTDNNFPSYGSEETSAGTSMWDTGKTSLGGSLNENSRSSDIIYAGTALSTDGSTYYWHIRFWDDSDAEGAWSTTQNFTMASNAAPSISSISRLFDNEKTADTTPAFTFTGTDPESANVDYEIRWDTDVNFGTATTKASANYPTDAGWTAATFTSGTAVTYTVQAADVLTNGTTYWWQVRARDPSGSNTWSSWSTARSFTIDTSVTVPTWYQTTQEQFDTDTLTGTTQTQATDDVRMSGP